MSHLGGPREVAASHRSPPRAASWRLRTRTLEFGDVPLLMGIINVTPDSFSDGGRHFSMDRAVEHARSLVHDGAAILDVGGESTRPYSEPVSVEEELSRVIPEIERLRGVVNVPISIDTTKAAVAQAALEAGAEILNDVSGLEADPEMLAMAVRSEMGVCAMHRRGTPQTMQDDPRYENVTYEVIEYLRQRRDALVSAGIEPEKICLDPGIGFGKTHAHNLQLIAECTRFHELGCPVLIGHSRKRFIGKLMGSDEVGARDTGTAALSLELGRKGIQVLRVHNVALHRGVFALLDAVTR